MKSKDIEVVCRGQVDGREVASKNGKCVGRWAHHSSDSRLLSRRVPIRVRQCCRLCEE